MPTSPRHSTAKPLLTSVGGGGPDTPNEQRTSSYISERKRQRRQRRDDTKLRHHPTENPACRPKRKIHRRVSRFPATSRPPIGTLPRNHPISGALFGTFPVREKYPAGGMDKPDLPANLPSHGKKTDTAEFPPCLNLSKSLTEFAALEPRKNPIRFFAAARTPQKTLCAQRSVAAPPIAGQGVDRSESRLVKKGIALFDQTQDSSIRSLSSSSPESLRNRSSRSSTVSFARSSPATSRTIFP